MAKLSLTDLTSLANETSVVNAINANNALIEAALEKTLSRDGTSPNTMTSNIDMNGYRLYNELNEDNAIVSVKDYGAVGDETTDDTDAISDAITAVNAAGGGCLYFPKGVYTVSDTLTALQSNICLKGQGKGISVIKAASDLGDVSIFRNNTFSSFTDTNISFFNITIDGNNLGNEATQTRSSALIEFRRITDFRMEGCGVRDYGYIGLAINSARHVLITLNEFDTLGYSGAAATVNGGPSIWITSTTGFDWPTDVVVCNNYFHDCGWHAAHLSCVRGSFSWNLIKDVKEGGLYVERSSSQEPSQMLIIGNSIDGVVKRDIAAHGIESAAYNSIIADNIIKSVDCSGIFVVNAQNVAVRGNTIMNTSLDPIGYGGIDIVCSSTSVGAAAVKNIEISGNRLRDTQTVQTMRHAVRIQGAGTAPANMVVRNNDFSGIAFTTSMYDFATLGASVRLIDNIGDYPYSTEEYNQLLGGDRSISNVDTAQAIFTSTSDTVTLQTGVTYEFFLRLRTTRSAGTTSHYTSLQFSGTATISSVDMLLQSTSQSGNTFASVQQIWGTAATGNTICGPSTLADENIHASIRGTFRCTSGGTLIPELIYTAAPGGTTTIKRGTFFSVRAIGTSNMLSNGPWS